LRNEEGVLITFGYTHDAKNCYLQIYANGIIETVNAEFLYAYQGVKRIPAGKTTNYEVSIIEAINEYIAFYARMKLLPASLTVIITKCKGYYVESDAFMAPLFNRRQISVEKLSSGPLHINGESDDVPAKLKPFFDTVWRGSGFDRSKNYTENGQWHPIR